MNRRDADIAKWCEHAGWLDNITPDEARCLAVLSSIDTGPHNVRPFRLGADERPAVMRYGFGIAAVLSERDWSTYDGSSLTSLVVAAHRRAVRVELRPCLIGTKTLDAYGERMRHWVMSYPGAIDYEWHPDRPVCPRGVTYTAAFFVYLIPRHPHQADRWSNHPSGAALARRAEPLLNSYPDRSPS